VQVATDFDLVVRRVSVFGGAFLQERGRVEPADRTKGNEDSPAEEADQARLQLRDINGTGLTYAEAATVEHLVDIVGF
jgi:hypothetical protein